MFTYGKQKQDNIPTLHDLVEEEVVSKKAILDKPASATDGSAAAAHATESLERQTRMRSAFEISIEAMVAEILDRHMANAREEITRSVLAEVRARLSSGRGKSVKGDAE